MSQVLSIISVIVSVLTLCGFGTLTKLLWQDHIDKKKKRSQEYIDQQSKLLHEQISIAVSTALDPIIQTITDLTTTNQIQKEALQAILRDLLYQLNRYCSLKQGYTTSENREDFENMYQKYHGMGKNGVMDDIHDRFFKLPSEEEFLRQGHDDEDDCK